MVRSLIGNGLLRGNIGFNQLRGTLALTTITSDRFISALDVPITKSYSIYIERPCRPDMVTASFYFPHTLVLGKNNFKIYKFRNYNLM